MDPFPPPPTLLAGSLCRKLAEQRVSGLLVCAWCLFPRCHSCGTKCCRGGATLLVTSRSYGVPVSRGMCPGGRRGSDAFSNTCWNTVMDTRITLAPFVQQPL